MVVCGFARHVSRVAFGGRNALYPGVIVRVMFLQTDGEITGDTGKERTKKTHDKRQLEKETARATMRGTGRRGVQSRDHNTKFQQTS